MRKQLVRIFLAAATFSLLGTGIDNAYAGIDPKSSSDKKEPKEQVLRTSRLLDLQQNTVSNIRFFTTNYGIFGLNIDANAGGGYWPRSSSNQYIFGGGIWFAAQKRVGDVFNKLVAISYNPNSGNSWFVPGRVNDGDDISLDANMSKKYRTYFSTDFGGDGTPVTSSDGPNWPIWDANDSDTLKAERYLGTYIDDITQRNVSTYPKGPAFISEEDIFSTFKDTDLRYYELGEIKSKERGYPMRLDIEQTIYSWGFGQYKNFIFLAYNIINRSEDTLRQCWMAPAMDMDIATASQSQAGAGNDRTRFYEAEPDLNLAIQWTNGDIGEAGKGFGYIGFDFLESPIINTDGRIMHDRNLTSDELAKFSTWLDSVKTNFVQLQDEYGFSVADTMRHLRLRALTDKQLESLGLPIYRPGLKTFRNWIIENDPKDDGTRYDFMSAGIRDGDDGPGDKRFLMATGPFDLYPGDTARVVVGLIMARTKSGGDATGSDDDLEELIRVDKFAQRVYDDNFRTPVPPDRAYMSWKPLNNGVIVEWDSTSEMSVDQLEDGLDFMGYVLYRARRIDFDVDDKPYDREVRPFAWKPIASWRMPLPFLPSNARVVVGDTLSPYIDSLRILGVSNKNIYNVARFGTAAWNGFFAQLTQAEINEYLTGRVIVNLASVPNPLPTLDALNSYIQSGYAEVQFKDIGKDDRAKQFMVTYMDSVTNKRTFIDLGDDNHNGTIDVTEDISTTERLINNVDYYYFLRSFDQGDQTILSPSKYNSARNGQNLIRTTPLAAPAGKNSEITVDITEQQKIDFAGFYNFRFNVEDQDRLRQLFSGHELEVSMEPIWFFGSFPFRNGSPYGYYGREMFVRDLTTGQLLATYNILPGNFNENAALFALGDDSTGIGIQDSHLKATRTGTISSKEDQYAPNQTVMGAFSFAFDYALQQWGGIYRGDSIYVAAGDANTVLTYNSTLGAVFIKADTASGRYRGYNNGPASYEVEFTAGGRESIPMRFGKSLADSRVVNFDVDYLNLTVRNIVAYERPSATGEKVTVNYPNEVPLFVVTDRAANGTPSPDPEDIPIGMYNLTAYGWVNGRTDDGFRARPEQAAAPADAPEGPNQGVPVGTQGRYYLSAQNGSDVVDFVHIFTASGVEFGLDYANKYARKSTIKLWDKAPVQPTHDFSAGDKVVFSTFGGGLGFPLPGAKFRVRISDGFPAIEEYTDAMLEEVKVVPNPYYISHIGQTTTDAGRLYFTKLPPKCTIRIFNIVGDLVKTIEHDDLTTEEAGKHPIEIWNLISESKQQVGSQTLIAKIEAPNGAESIVKFTVVLGGFRLVPE